MLNNNTKITVMAVITSAILLIKIILTEDNKIHFAESFTAGSSQMWGEAINKGYQQQLSRGLSNLNLYFGGEVIIHKYEPAPGGAIEVEAEIDGLKRLFYVLSDNATIIEGQLLSPFMDNRHVKANSPAGLKHIAQNNQSQLNQFEQTRKQLTESINEQVQKEKPNFTPKNLNINKGATANNPVAPLRLPEQNQIFDKTQKDKFYQITQSLEYIEFGEKEAPEIYVYFDLNCPGCREAKSILDKYTSTGQLRVRYVPVGMIRDDSPFKAAYTLIPSNNEDRQKLMDYFKQPATFESLVRTKAPEEDFKRGLQSVLDANKAMMMLPKKITPTFLVKDKGIVSIANITSEQGVKRLVAQLNSK